MRHAIATFLLLQSLRPAPVKPPNVAKIARAAIVSELGRMR